MSYAPKHRHTPLEASPPYNCTCCGAAIVQDTANDKWYTEAEEEAYINEQIEEAEYEARAAEYETLHPESRCPPRE